MARLSKFGDWTRAGAVLQGISVKLYPAFEAQIREDGDLILKTLINHIDAQDLPWAPLSKKTIELKGGDSTIYVETGFLKEHLKVRKIRSAKGNLTLFVGASAWIRNKEGVKLSDLMIWLEYGTDKAPPRPLIRPTWEEVAPILHENWEKTIKDLIENGGR